MPAYKLIPLFPYKTDEECDSFVGFDDDTAVQAQAPFNTRLCHNPKAASIWLAHSLEDLVTEKFDWVSGLL